MRAAGNLLLLRDLILPEAHCSAAEGRSATNVGLRVGATHRVAISITIGGLYGRPCTSAAARDHGHEAKVDVRKA